MTTDIPAPQLNDGANKTSVKFDFHGTGKEFFQIWIVNVLLTILTLGIYSAWAKVRTEQYFLGNTELDNHRFSYLAKPLDILKGRLIAAGFFIAYAVASQLYPVAAIGILVVLLIAMPFLICSSMRFNMRMISYRNVRFNFKGKYWHAFIGFILLPIVSALTLWIALPFTLYYIDNFLLRNSCFGEKQFKPELKIRKYYITALILIGLTLLVVVAFAIFAFLSTAILGGPLFDTLSQSSVMGSVLALVLMALYLFAITLVRAYYQVTIRNHIMENTEVDTLAKFQSSFEVGSFTKLVFTNLLLLMATFGLAYPWVRVRTTNYVVNHTHVLLSENKDHIIDHNESSESAIGDEVANLFDVDVALG